jgi:hypothetical protein
MKISKVIIPLVATTVLGYFAAKRINFGKSSKVISDIAKFASDETVNAVEKTFGGLKQGLIEQLVLNTYKGVKAVINGDILEYWYKSNSGKHNYMSSLRLDSAGKIIIERGYFGSNPPNSPVIFAENLIEEMKKAK